MNEDIKKAVEVLRAGGIILYPTDTIWGIGCDARDEAAVRRIYEIKRRSDSKSLILLTDAAGKIQQYSDEMPDVAWDIIELSDRPTTIIYSGAKNLAQNVIAEDGSVGIRVTTEAFTKRLCEMFRFPIVSTSANISGEPSPACFDEVSEEIKSQVDYIVTYRQSDKTKATPSKIIKLGKNGEVKIIR